MVKRFYNALPGPAAIRIVIMVAILVVALLLLGMLFEWAGDFIDNGGVIE